MENCNDFSYFAHERLFDMLIPLYATSLGPFPENSTYYSEMGGLGTKHPDGIPDKKREQLVFR